MAFIRSGSSNIACRPVESRRSFGDHRPHPQGCSRCHRGSGAPRFLRFSPVSLAVKAGASSTRCFEAYTLMTQAKLADAGTLLQLQSREASDARAVAMLEVHEPLTSWFDKTLRSKRLSSPASRPRR